MGCSRLFAVVAVVAGCAHAGGAGRTVAVRDACSDTQRWDGHACVARHAADAFTANELAMKVPDIDAALAALDRAATEPLDLIDHTKLWELRATALAYVADAETTPANEQAADAAFDRLLAIDPDHRIACDVSEQATRRFERNRRALAARAPRELELTWPRDSKVGAPVPLDIETVADPSGVLATATIYLRARGATAWQAADVTLPAPGRRTRVRLPAIDATAATAVEIYAVAHDPDGNDTLAWASAAHPRDIALGYQAPTPWYRTWWVWAIAGGAVALGAGITTYALTWSPSGEIGGGVHSRLAPMQ